MGGFDKPSKRRWAGSGSLKRDLEPRERPARRKSSRSSRARDLDELAEEAAYQARHEGGFAGLRGGPEEHARESEVSAGYAAAQAERALKHVDAGRCMSAVGALLAASRLLGEAGTDSRWARAASPARTGPWRGGTAQTALQRAASRTAAAQAELNTKCLRDGALGGLSRRRKRR